MLVLFATEATAMAMYSPVSLIGVPTDIGAGHRGAGLGPDALRIAGLGDALTARGVDVRDLGNLDGPRNPWTAPVQGYRHLDEVVAWNRALMEATYGELQAGRMPIMLDHRGRALVPRTGQGPARAVAGCAFGFQHQRGHPVGQRTRHAGGLPVWAGPGRADPPRR